MVKRYDPTYTLSSSGQNMYESVSGDYAEFSDYEKLEAENRHLQAKLTDTEIFIQVAKNDIDGKAAIIISAHSREDKYKAEIAHLKAKLAEAEKTIVTVSARFFSEEAVEKVQKENEELRRDAERYRYLKDNSGTYTSKKVPLQLIIQEHHEIHSFPKVGFTGYRFFIDKVIDAEMHQKTGD